MSSSLWRIFNVPHPDPLAHPLVSTPWPVALIVGSYLLFVLKLGKKFMENRQPYNVKNIMLIYNLYQVYFNAHLCYTIANFVFFEKTYDLRCMESLPLDHPKKTMERMLTNAYYINKIVDLLDTIFFVLRKNYKQISILHLYHHVMMVSLGYGVLRIYGPGGYPSMLSILNTFIHTIMYFYYFLAALRPDMGGKMWWKKYITLAQIAQFVILFLHVIYTLVFSQNCGFPKSLMLLGLSQCVIMVYMFTRFYIRAYVRPQNQKQC